MKLSEAILLGSTMGPQITGKLFGPNDSSCALGAALLASGLRTNHISVATLWPWVLEVDIACPACGTRDWAPCLPIAHLNDKHKWTRERIAGWIAAIESPMRNAQAALLMIGLRSPEFTAADLPGEVTAGSKHLAGAATGALVATGLLEVVRRIKSPDIKAKGRKLDVLRISSRNQAKAWLRANDFDYEEAEKPREPVLNVFAFHGFADCDHAL